MSNQPLKDQSGATYSSPDGKPAASGVPVTIHGSNGPTQGTMVSGYVAPNKK